MIDSTFVSEIMSGKEIPNYSIAAVRGGGRTPEDLMAMRFGEYLGTRDYLFTPHRHSFYHLVYFSRGAGRHSIDFVHHTVRPGQIYFMNPGQVHNWEFEGAVDGYIVNFTARHFQMMLASAQYLERFSFFSGQSAEQVIDLPETLRPDIEGLLEKVVGEAAGRAVFAEDMILSLLIQLFITVSRTMETEGSLGAGKPGIMVLRNFRRQIEEHFMTMRLPKDYAALLYVTPNYLNSLCKDLLGVSAGEVIRERVLLEAKRLLVNGGLSISEIAWQLNFQDNSYFSKFFKKYAAMTPEDFRRLYHVAGNKQ